MVIKISKKTTKLEAKRAMDKLHRSRKKNEKSLKAFYGALKGAFGDGLSYQKSMRNEWE